MDLETDDNNGLFSSFEPADLPADFPPKPDVEGSSPNHPSQAQSPFGADADTILVFGSSLQDNFDKDLHNEANNIEDGDDVNTGDDDLGSLPVRPITPGGARAQNDADARGDSDDDGDDDDEFGADFEFDPRAAPKSSAVEEVGAGAGANAAVGGAGAEGGEVADDWAEFDKNPFPQK
jgi:hypothetical protein